MSPYVHPHDSSKCKTTTRQVNQPSSATQITSLYTPTQHGILGKTMKPDVPIQTFKIKSNYSYFRSLDSLSESEDEARTLGSIDDISRTARSLSCANTGRYWRPPKPLPAENSLSSAASISTPLLTSFIALIQFGGSKAVELYAETRGECAKWRG